MAKVKLGQVDVELGGNIVDALGNVLLKCDTNKLAFFGATAIVKPTAYTQTYDIADKIHANPTGVAITDNSGGIASQTIAAIYGGSAGTAVTTNEPCETATKDAIASLADEVNKLIADVADVKQLVNSVIDDLQALGLVG